MVGWEGMGMGMKKEVRTRTPTGMGWRCDREGMRMGMGPPCPGTGLPAFRPWVGSGGGAESSKSAKA